MKVFHIANDARCSYIVSQGLLNIGCDVKCDIDYKSLGKTLIAKSPIEELSYAELIFCGNTKYVNLFNKLNLWKRVIFYEFRDSTQINTKMLECLSYFKRSVYHGPDREPIDLKGVIPINHCAMDEYFMFNGSKTHNVGCFFDSKNWRLGKRRRGILEAVKKENFENSLVGASTSFANPARLAVSHGYKDNPFVEYLKMINSCKIIFTAQPEPVDGDHRTWEALASNSLVFKDLSWIPTPNHIRSPEHCIEYDASDDSSIMEAIDKAYYYLKNEEKAIKIARSGYEFVKKHHRSADRVRFMIKHSMNKNGFLL